MEGLIMKAPAEATLVLRCASNKGCTLAYVVGGTAWAAEATLVLTKKDSEPSAHQSRLKQASGFQPYDLEEEMQDPTNCTVACRCADWGMNMGSVAAMVRDGTTGEVIHDGPQIPRRPTVSNTM